LKVTGTTAANKTYDGTIAAAVTLGTVSGIISADVNDVTVTPTGVFVSKTAADNKDVTVTYSLSGNKAANYTAPDAETVKADIAKKQLTATEYTAANKTYDGNTNAAVTFTLNGVEAGDTVNVSATGSFNDKTAAGNKDVTVSFTMEEGNYLAPVPATVKADILQRQLIMENTCCYNKQGL
jgi:S-adenosylmethionine synthetase